MVSKTFVCIAILALVAVCSSAPSHNDKTQQRRNLKQSQNQRISCPDSNSNSDSSSNESSQEPCDLTNQKQQQKQRNLQVQDTSAEESGQWAGKKMKVRMSQEDNSNSQEIREAPKHQPMNQGRTGPAYMRGQQVRDNIQKSRRGNDDTDSNENNSRAEQNQIQRKNQW